MLERYLNRPPADLAVDNPKDAIREPVAAAAGFAGVG
jgi:hypothetical protein